MEAFMTTVSKMLWECLPTAACGGWARRSLQRTFFGNSKQLMSISKRDVSREVESVFTALAKARVRKDMDPEVLKSSQYLDSKLESYLKLDWYNEQAVKSEARRQANQPPDWICLLLQRDRDARRAWQLLKAVQTSGWGGSSSKPKPAKGQPQNPEKEAYVDSAALEESQLELKEERAAQGLSNAPGPSFEVEEVDDWEALDDLPGDGEAGEKEG